MVDLDLSNADRRLAERALANKHIKSAAWQYIHLACYLLAEEFPDIALGCINTVVKGGKLTITDAYNRLTDMRAKGTAAKHQGPPRQLKVMDSVKQEGTWVRDTTLELERARGLRMIKEKEAAKVQAELRNVEESIAAHAMIDCGCCFSEAPLNRTICCDAVENGHYFCYECGAGLVKSELGNGRCRPKCMDTNGCTADITIAQLTVCVDKKTLDHLLRLQQQEDIKGAFPGGKGDTNELLEGCPWCDYLAICPPKEVYREYECGNPECMKISCRLCQKLTHAPKTCEDAVADAKINARHTVEEAMSEALVRSCNKCKTKFIKESGCNKMTCYKCHNTQCYLCSENVTGYDHFDRGKCAQDDGRVGLDAYHAAQVKKAEELARAKVQNERPDLSAEDLTIKVSDKVKQAEAAAAAAAAARRQHLGYHHGLVVPGPALFGPIHKEEIDDLDYLFVDDDDDYDDEVGRLDAADLGGLMHVVPRGAVNFGPVNNFAGAGHRLPGQPAVRPLRAPALPLPANVLNQRPAQFQYLRHPATGPPQQPHALERPPGTLDRPVAPLLRPAEPLHRLPRTYQAPAVTAARMVRHARVAPRVFVGHPYVPRPHVEAIPVMPPPELFLAPSDVEEVQFLGSAPLVTAPHGEAARQRQQEAGLELQKKPTDQPLNDELAARGQQTEREADHRRRRDARRLNTLEIEREQHRRAFRTQRQAQIEQAIVDGRNRQLDASILEPRPGQNIIVDLTSTGPEALPPFFDLSFGTPDPAFDAFFALDHNDMTAPLYSITTAVETPLATPVLKQEYGQYRGFGNVNPRDPAANARPQPQAPLFAPTPPTEPRTPISAPPGITVARPPLANKRKYDHNIQTRLPVLPVTKIKTESNLETQEMQMKLLAAQLGKRVKMEPGLGTRDEPIMLDG